MKTRKLFDVFNIVLCIYGLISIILHFFDYSSTPPDVMHIIMSVITVVLWMAQFLLPKETNGFTSVSFLVIINIWPFADLWKLIPFVALFLVLVIQKRCKIKEILTAFWDVCVLLVICAVLILIDGRFFAVEYLTNHISNEETNYYLSEDGTYEIEIYSCDIDGLGVHRYFISCSKGFSVDLGLREYKRFVDYFGYDLQYKEDKSSSFKWVDNDTFEFAEKQYDIIK